MKILLTLLASLFLASPAASADLPLRDLTLPDPVLTPGAAVEITLANLCSRKWGRDARHVTAAMKREVFASYGLTGNKDASQGCRLDKHGRRYEVDHLVSRELGGRDDTLNLWPQCYSGEFNAMMKDRLENRLHKEICVGIMTLDDAQTRIRTNWIAAYRQFFEQQGNKK